MNTLLNWSLEYSKETQTRTFWLPRFTSQREYSTKYSTGYSEILDYLLLKFSSKQKLINIFIVMKYAK